MARRDGVLDLTYGLVTAFAGESAVGPIRDTQRDTAPYACDDRRLGLTEQASADGVAFAATSMGSPLRLTWLDCSTVAERADSEHAARRAWDATLTEFAAADEAMSRFSETSGLTALNRWPGPASSWRSTDASSEPCSRQNGRGAITEGHFDPRVLDRLESVGEHGAGLGREVGQRGATRPWRSDRSLPDTSTSASRSSGPSISAGSAKIALRGQPRRSSRGRRQRSAGRGWRHRPAWQGAGRRRMAGRDQNPAGGSIPVAVMAPPAGAVATSSIRRRSWMAGDRRVHHLLDPRTGEPAWNGLRSVTVSARDPAWAEVWSKALFVGGRPAIGETARRRGLAAWWVAEEGVPR